MKQYGQIIAKLRKQNNLTQAELGKKLSVSYQAVSKWENNQSQPDLDTIQLLADVFGISVGEFLDYDNPQPKTTTAQQASPRTLKNQIWYLVSALAVAIFIMILIVALVPIKLSSDKIYNRVDPAVFCLTLETADGSQMAGTGFFINEKGLAVTNYHVIENCISGQAQLNNGKTYAVTKVVGCDEKRDIAIIQVDITKNKKVALGNSDKIKVGETVYAIGYPQSFVLGSVNSTLTQGIISKISYTYEENNYIQTTVNLTHGNSGGVLLNEQGKVIGITTLMLTDGTIDYMNMAIPINAIHGVKRNLDYTLSEYTGRNITFNFYSHGKIYKSLDIVKGDVVDEITMPDETGYKFIGWYRDTTFSEKFDFSLPINEDSCCYAGWLANKYVVRFLPNGGDGEMVDQTFYYGQWQKLAPNLFTKSGCQFVGWLRKTSTEQDPVKYVNMQYVFDLTANDGEIVELLAIWGEPKLYMLKFHRDSGVYGTMPEYSVKCGEQARLPQNQFYLTGYRFAGWRFKYLGDWSEITFQDRESIDYIIGVVDTNPDSINSSQLIELYAIWEPITYQVVYIQDESSVGQNEISVAVEYGKQFDLLGNDVFSRPGYHSVRKLPRQRYWRKTI